VNWKIFTGSAYSGAVTRQSAAITFYLVPQSCARFDSYWHFTILVHDSVLRPRPIGFWPHSSRNLAITLIERCANVRLT
jgi:hypothetical protein